MASIAAQTQLTPEEYLAWERKEAFKNEYDNRQIVAMYGASRAHNRIVLDTSIELSNQFRERDCEVFAGEVRVKTGPLVSYFYPDVGIVCGAPRFEDDVFDRRLNLVVIFEVLSPSTTAYDLGENFEHYKQLTSLKAYILVAQDKVRVEHYRRHQTQWEFTEFHTLEEVLRLTACHL